MSQEKEVLLKEAIATQPKHWIRLTTACNNRCLFCLDANTPRDREFDEESIKEELRWGREEKGALKVVLSGGEPTVHRHFVSLVRYAREIGYERVQIVSNGVRLGENKAFFAECLDAGLNEITFSLHGHTAALHDKLTRNPGSFKKLMKALIRALRDGRPVVNVDVVINRQNVEVLDKIVELAIAVGVTEFDLLHIIPQGEAYRHRAELFYNPRDHLKTLQKVFALSRHPRFYVWTNRFPIPFLEGMEDLIQDPHKILDEIRGRRFQIRKYLDRGEPLSCREKDRCKFCFIEPFCTTMDRVIHGQNKADYDVWWIGDVDVDLAQMELPFGCTYVGVDHTRLEQLDLPPHTGLYVQVEHAEPVGPGDNRDSRPTVLVAQKAQHLETWLAEPLPRSVLLEIQLNNDTATWMVEHRSLVENQLPQLHLHLPPAPGLKEAMELQDPRAFFAKLQLPIRASGLPACLMPGAIPASRLKMLPKALFDGETGRIDLFALAHHHIQYGYCGKSCRCDDCRLNRVCDGLQVNWVRVFGLAALQPLLEGEEVLAPSTPLRLATGRTAEPAAPSLPGFPEAPEPPEDPLALAYQEED
ncbi:MAG: radical SAM protein [Proteobacteria bacterium]|nr:radical SAM protein [Pseudomonadota bacterium]